MAVATSTCTAPCGCDRPAARSGLCWGHVRAKQRGHALVPLLEKPKSAFARLVSAALVLADAGDDDTAYERAEDNLRKASDAHRRGSRTEAIKDGLAAARARGVRLGRPPTRDELEISEVVKSVGGIERAARLLRISRGTVRRAVRRVKGQGGP